MDRRQVEQAVTGEGDVDHNPMLDVVFILLIFFVVTATFVRESGIDAHASDKKAARGH